MVYIMKIDEVQGGDESWFEAYILPIFHLHCVFDLWK